MVSPVEQAAATAFFNGVFGWIILELQKNYRLWRKVWQECKSLEKELLMLASAMDDELRNSRTNGAPPRRATARAFSEEMRELTHDIEDCIERFLPRLACKEEVSWPGRYAHTVKTSHTRLKFAKEIKKLHARSKEARQRIFTPPTAAATTTAAATPEPEPALPDNPVGISEAKVKLRSLLLDTEASNRSGPDPAQLTVVVIVGFGGSGKTTLARAVFDSLGGDTEFPSRAWVSMSLLERRDAHGVRQEIHKQLRPGQEYSENSLTDHLKAKGYLVVIDDIKIEHMEHWDHIRKIFKGKGKIIVTTAVQSVANRCSSSGENNGVKYFGYVYKMRAFGKEDSRLIALQGRCTTEILENSANLLKKCDGLPLALASVARQLDSEDEPTGQFCSKLCSDLGSYLHREDDEEPNFARLRGVLMDNYTSLSNYTVRTCLLYLSIFPANRPIRRNVIIRRWMAEGYARSDTLDGEKIADGNFRTFLDRNIIHAGPSQNATAKKCKTPGILHEFMLHKSMSKKFIMPFGANKQKKVRHLFIHNNNDTDSRMTLKTDLSCVRSLTVLGNAGVAISDFRKYKLIRVLDLEECTDVNDGHLMDICKLYNLRYLSLGHSINTVPKEIGQLKLLETLVLSKTRENVLPIEAIGLPCLIHLVGKFKFQDPVNRQQLPTEPKMKMLTGFIADGSEGFLQLIEHMKELNKIKIWCKSVDVEADRFPAQRIAQMNNGLTDAIQKYIEAPITMGGCRALSIDFQALPDGYLHALGDLCNHSVQTGRMYYLSSLKLYGNTSSLPEFVRLFRNLSELCLSTNLTQEFFSALGEMTCLLYLKLIADRFDSFTIQAEKFKSLRRMCFEFNRTNPALLTISCGALPELTSLQLICEHLVDLCVIELRWINQLKEIVLHPDVSEQTINKWETAAMDHPNRPNVFPHRKSDDPRNEPAPDQTSSRLPAVATEALGRSSMSSGHMNSTSDKSGFPVRVKRSRRPRLLSFLARRRSTYENSKNFGKY